MFVRITSFTGTKKKSVEVLQWWYVVPSCKIIWKYAVISPYFLCLSTPCKSQQAREVFYRHKKAYKKLLKRPKVVRKMGMWLIAVIK